LSEVDVDGSVLSTFTDVKVPRHVSTDTEGHVVVADFENHRILLLNSQLQPERVLVDVDSHSQAQLWYPTRLRYNEQAQQLYVIHSSSSVWGSLLSNTVSLFSV